MELEDGEPQTLSQIKCFHSTATNGSRLKSPRRPIYHSFVNVQIFIDVSIASYERDARVVLVSTTDCRLKWLNSGEFCLVLASIRKWQTHRHTLTKVHLAKRKRNNLASSWRWARTICEAEVRECVFTRKIMKINLEWMQAQSTCENVTIETIQQHPSEPRIQLHVVWLWLWMCHLWYSPDVPSNSIINHKNGTHNMAERKHVTWTTTPKT